MSSSPPPSSTLSVVGVVRSCEKESLEPQEGKVTGTFPSWLEGSLLRNGPGLFEVGPDEYHHLFDGMSLLHRFNVQRGGKVTYQNRFLKSTTYQRNMKAGRIVVGEFGTVSHPDPCASIFERLKSVFTSETTDNANINVMKIGDGYYVATETQFITRIDPETLETKEKVDLKKLFAVNLATAHPHYDTDGGLLNMGSTFARDPSYCIFKFPAKGDESLAEGSVLCRIPFSSRLYPSYFHSFGLSDRYVIFVEQPLVISVPGGAMQYVTGGTITDILHWNPQQLVRFHLVDRSTGERLPNHFVASPFMVFHHANAYDTEDGQVVVDLCTYKDDGIVKSLYLKEMRGDQLFEDFLKNTESKTLRFVLPLKQHTKEQVSSEANLVTLGGSRATATAREDGTVFCQPENLTEGLIHFEMPQMNYGNFNGKKYRYLYGVAKPRDEPLMKGLAKVDVEKRSHVMWLTPNGVPSEPVFVPRPSSTEEDDGILLCSLLSEEEEKNVSLVVLDARSMAELARADFQCPAAVPSDFHGRFLKR